MHFSHYFCLILILNIHQSWLIRKVKGLQTLHKYQMSEGKAVFTELVTRVEEGGQFLQILKKELPRYQIQTYKLETVTCKIIRNAYETQFIKYFKSKDVAADPENWLQHERKLFFWFMLFYVYFQRERGESPISINTIQSSICWQSLSPVFFNKSPNFLLFHYLNMLKSPNKLAWTPEDDNLVIQQVKVWGTKQWGEVSKAIFYKSNLNNFKFPKHCRERYLNHLDSNKKKGQWTLSEDLQILEFVAEHGKRWCRIIPLLKDTRTQHMIKNRFNALIARNKASKKYPSEQVIEKIIKNLRKSLQRQNSKQKAEAIKKQHLQQSSEWLHSNAGAFEDIQKSYPGLVKIEADVFDKQQEQKVDEFPCQSSPQKSDEKGSHTSSQCVEEEVKKEDEGIINYNIREQNQNQINTWEALMNSREYYPFLHAQSDLMRLFMSNLAPFGHPV